MKLVRFPDRPPDWDQRISSFATKTLFHESAWHDHILTIHPGSRIDYYQILHNGDTVGYFCAYRLKKLFLSVYGSPLRGTGTNFMGPAINEDADQSAVLRAILQVCRKNRIAHLELSHPWLSSPAMDQSGFAAHPDVTHLIQLPAGEDDTWQLLKSTCRNRVRKGQKNGLIVEATDDPSIVDHYYEQFQEVYAKQGLAVPFGIDRPRSLFEKLLPAGRILPLWVKHEGNIVATGLFPLDEKCVYFWGAASWLKYHDLCPNELLHWTVMQMAVQRKIPLYNMCGGGSSFKSKFGGEDVPYIHYSFSFLPFLDVARKLYLFLHFQKLKVLGMLRPSSVPKRKRVG